MREVQVVMHPVKTTPGTYFYEVPSDKKMNAPIKNAYISKSAFGGAVPPSELTFILRWE